MSRLQQLIDNASKEKSLMEKAYGDFPVEIASECGKSEVKEIIERLDALSSEKTEVEEWDGDTQDDIWRAQSGFSELLENILPNYASDICKGLESKYTDTRFYICYALSNSPSAEAVDPLSEYMKSEMSEEHRDIVLSALKACKKKIGILK
uniref:hypothetical protein n=1 Tax=Sulfurovum sp. TaxID=1969726 RepID=UPI0025E4D29A